uniref:Serine carboxypeptidase-like 18 n=1 Tax=Kalanchoe fedtschenkoi TaxID=63787 RepID=A0A7N0TWM8_KALFE
MAGSVGSSSDHKRIASFSLLVILALLSLSACRAFGSHVVKFLPGYRGQLPFHLETGYVSVDDSELFYYFIESQGNPSQDPIFLWLTGGPGCSAFNGLIYEIGPMQFDIHNYPGGPPSLLPLEDAWTKTASIIFVDLPAGSGFSYSRTQAGWPSSDTLAAEQAFQFLVKWLLEHPKYLPLELFISGDSYTGMFIPVVTKKVLERNIAGAVPSFNLKGYLIGSPTTDEALNSNSKIVFAHRMALISDELYERLKVSCNKSYINVEPSNAECTEALQAYNLCVQGVGKGDILEPNCAFVSPRNPENGDAALPRRFLQKISGNSLLVGSPDRNLQLERCRTYNYTLAPIWANDPRVIEALHVRKGTVRRWVRCNQSLSYTKDVESVIPVHKYLTRHDLNVLIQTGDRDMVVPHVATRAWVQELGLAVDSNWRPWFVGGQVAGYTEEYDSDASGYRLVYATVKGAGHPAPEYYRKECYQMFDRWVHTYPL